MRDRELFVPDRIYRLVDGDPVPVDRATEPDRWASMVADDGPIITQVDGREVTSSISDRRVVAEMLDLLDLQPDDSVLEIGTGSGWNTALLSDKDAWVLSIEIDPELADRAVENLERAGANAVLDTADGTVDFGNGFQYDRLIATVGVETIPAAWVRQTKAGGTIVAPLTNRFQPPGIAVLTRTETGAEGRIAGPASFMSLRGTQPRVNSDDYSWENLRFSTTLIHPHSWSQRDPALFIGQKLPDITWTYRDGTVWLYGQDKSCAFMELAELPMRPYVVEQGGPRDLVTEIEDAFQAWQDAGSPAVSDWRITVDLDGNQRMYFEEKVRAER